MENEFIGKKPPLFLLTDETNRLGEESETINGRSEFKMESTSVRRAKSNVLMHAKSQKEKRGMRLEMVLGVLEVLYSTVVRAGSPVEPGCCPVGEPVPRGVRVVVHCPSDGLEDCSLKLLGCEGCAQSPV